MSVNNDINGKESSKRKWGGRYLSATLFFCVTYFLLLVVAWTTGKELFTFPVQLIALTAGVGTALLGVTVLEKPKQ